MTDEAKALVAPDMIDLFRIIRRAGRSDRAKAEALADFMQLIEIQAREIERLRGLLREAEVKLTDVQGAYATRQYSVNLLTRIRAALAGDSHDQ